MQVAARYNARVVHIETIGTMFNDREEVGGGSGLLVGDNLVLTNSHVIPAESTYRTLVINVRPKTRHLSPPLQARLVDRDQEQDLAILELTTIIQDAAGARCPMPAITDAESAPMGTRIYVLGFPLNQNLSITGGLISNHEGDKGRWQTDSVINPGNSGGPVFDDQGALIGIAVGGIVKWTIGGETRNVYGVNFLVPSPVLKRSPLFARISAVPAERRCWKDASPLESAQIFMEAIETISDPRRIYGDDLTLPPQINRIYTVSETKDNHPVFLSPHSQTYSKRFQAEPSYSVTSCTWTSETANHASDIKCSIEPGGTSALFEFRLTSGPAVDRWRGWWGGAVTLQQQQVRIPGR